MPTSEAAPHRYSDCRRDRPRPSVCRAPRNSAHTGSSACSTPISATYTLMKMALPTESAASEASPWRPATMVSVTPNAITASCPASTVMAWREMVESSDITPASFGHQRAGPAR
jgi:hypothetical protein